MDDQSRSIDETAVYIHDNDYYVSALAINQDTSTAPYETTSDNHDNYYYASTLAIDQNVSRAPHQSYAGHGNDHLDQFADPNHQFYADFNVNYASNNNFPSDTYSQELDLHTDLPNFTSSSPGRQDQYSYPPVDPELAWQEVKDRGHHTTSPWDPVPLDPDYLAPNYRRPPSTTYRTIASSATRSQADEHSLFTTHTPPDWDAVSSRSGLSVSSGATTCGACGKSFGDARVARRHETEVHHKDGDPEYVCKCNNYRVPSKRNYIRHVQGSCKEKGLPDAVYICKCLEQCTELDAHVAHVRECGKKRPGRPPNSSRTHSAPSFIVSGDQVSVWHSPGLFQSDSAGM